MMSTLNPNFEKYIPLIIFCLGMILGIVHGLSKATNIVEFFKWVFGNGIGHFVISVFLGSLTYAIELLLKSMRMVSVPKNEKAKTLEILDDQVLTKGRPKSNVKNPWLFYSFGWSIPIFFVAIWIQFHWVFKN